MNRIEKAKESMKKGYNCSQAVACAFCDEVGIDEKTMFAIMEGFGRGMGDMQGICGALSGAIAILSMKNSGADPENPSTRLETYKKIQELKNRFKEKNGSDICCELKGIKTKTPPLRSCDGCVEDAAAILEELINSVES